MSTLQSWLDCPFKKHAVNPPLLYFLFGSIRLDQSICDKTIVRWVSSILRHRQSTTLAGLWMSVSAVLLCSYQKHQIMPGETAVKIMSLP